MNEISSKDLKKKIDDKDDFKLIFCLAENSFRAIHIPGSICLPITQKSIKNKSDLKENIERLLDIDDEIVVYCTDVGCVASIFLYQKLEQFDYKNIRRFSGGLRKWEVDGYAFDGEMVN